MLDLVNNIIDVVTEPIRSKPLIQFEAEFKDGYARDTYILINILEGYASQRDFIPEEKFELLINFVRTSNEQYLKEVVLPVLEKAHGFRSNPVEFVKRHYGSKASVRRIVGYYRPIKPKK